MDEEGGRVSRLPDQFPRLPVNGDIGRIGSATLANQVGQILAQRVKGLGFNVNYAPVLDINSNPDNPVIGNRSYGADPDLVTRLGLEAMKGIQSQGVISVIKHFPGHGDTAVDSHVGLPQVEADLERLRTFELLPFREAIKTGADMVMTAHILLPKLDPQHPATLSQRIISGLLREELQFGGVVITDDLCMAAIKDNYDLGEAAVQAISAGVDIVTVCHDYENYITVLNALRDAAAKGIIPVARIDEAVTRILKLKERYQLEDSSTPLGNVEAINEDTADLLDRLN